MVGLGLISYIPTSFQLPLVYIPMSFHSELYCVTYPLVIFPSVSNELPSGTLTIFDIPMKNSRCIDDLPILYPIKRRDFPYY